VNDATGVWKEGVVAGILGATALALWFLLVDWTQETPLRTPSVLGSLLFRGEAPREGVHVASVVGYTVFHYAVFIAVGIAAAAVARRIEARPRVVLAVLVFFMAVQAFTLAFTTVLTETLAGTIRWWMVAFGNLIGVGVMVVYLWLRHRSASRVTDDREVFDPRQ